MTNYLELKAIKASNKNIHSDKMGLIIRWAIMTNSPFLFYLLALRVKAYFQQAIQIC